MGSGKSKISGRVNYTKIEDYKAFIAKNPSSDISYDDFITIIKESTKEIKNQILENTLGFKLPHNLGYISVDKFKPNKNFVAVDWINTRRLKKIVPLTNFHTFGHTYKIKLYKNPKVKPLYAYHMEAHRLLKRELAKRIKENKDEYINIERSYYSKRFNINNFLKSE